MGNSVSTYVVLTNAPGPGPICEEISGDDCNFTVGYVTIRDC